MPLLRRAGRSRAGSLWWRPAVHRGLPGLLPALSEQEALEVAAIHSVASHAPLDSWPQRPFRHPHHSASGPALVGGGSRPQPGETVVVEMPDQRLVAIQPLEPQEDDTLMDDLLASNPRFQALVTNSKASRRKTYSGPGAGNQ